jgi:hypothetical protein
MRTHQGISLMYRRSTSAASAVASEIFLGLGSDLSNRISLLLREKRFKELLDIKINPLDYSCPSKFRDDYLCSELLSKFDSFDLDIDRSKLAIEKFLAAEKHCEQTNSRLSSRYEPGCLSPYSPESFIWTARGKIARLLGPLNWDECSQYFGFGPGASTSLRRNRSEAYFKFGVAKPHTTEANSVLAYTAIRSVPRWYNYLSCLAGRDPDELSLEPIWKQIDSLLTIVPGNRITTVPKSAKIDRVIAIEPDLNMYIQKGIGGVIRSRLKRVGIDLNDQSRNQRLALEGSTSNKLCTIDLSAASDSISLELCRLLLPDDWFLAIKQSRSPVGTLPDGKLLTYHKVSSMGNGFTFELESLLFWALASSVVTLLTPADRRLAIYGDDIIMSSSISHTYLWLLKFVGFTANEDKTFIDGPFRESCGKHYFLGVDVTPFYIRKDIASPDRLIWAANSIRSWAKLSYGLDPRLRRAYQFVLSELPAPLRKPTIPESLGHIALWGDFDEVCPKKLGNGIEGFRAYGFSCRTEYIFPDDEPLLIRNLFNLQKRDNTPPFSSGSIVSKKIEEGLDACGVIHRSPRVKWRVVKPPVVQWESYGPWLGP